VILVSQLTGNSANSANYSTYMCSGSEAGSYLRLIDFVYYSTLGLRVMKKKKNELRDEEEHGRGRNPEEPREPQKSIRRPLPSKEGTPYQVVRTFT